MDVIPDMSLPHARMNLDLNLLVALEALLSESSVTRAAARVGLSQSAMSHKLRRLREQFGDPLLVQVGGGLARTPYADELLGPLRHGLRELHGVWSGPRAFDPMTSDREFIVVSSDYAEFAILPLVLQYARTHAPNIRCRLLNPGPGADSRARGRNGRHRHGPVAPPAGGLRPEARGDGAARVRRA